MLERLFSSRARVELLSILFLQPEKEFYLREIARITREDYKNISRELKNLETLGLLTSRKTGNLKYFSLNRKFPIFEELKSIFFKTRGVAKIIKEALQAFEIIDYAFIYGSFASGTENEKSDVDLMVIGKIALETLLKLLKAPEKALSREINPSLYELSEIESRLRDNDPFITKVMNEPKIMLIGDESGLRRSAA